MKKVLVCLIEGFEEIEAMTIIDVLRRAEIETVSVSLGASKQVRGDHGVIVEADELFSEAAGLQADMIVLPGGNLGSQNLLKHEALHKQLLQAEAAGAHIAAICAATMTLGRIGLTQGKQATCYPGVEQELLGAKISEQAVVVDGKLITSRGPATSIPFALALVEALRGKAVADEVADGLLASKSAVV